MNWRLLLLVIAGTVLVTSVGTGMLASWHATEPASDILSSPVTQSLKACGQLAVLCVDVKDVVGASTAKEDLKQLWEVWGSGMISVDLRKAIIQPHKTDEKSAVIVLPRPKLLYAGFDHSKTKFCDMRETYKAFDSANDAIKQAEKAFQEAESRLQSLCGSEDLIEQARVVANALIKRLFESAGFSVQIEWQDMRQPVGPVPAGASTPQAAPQ